MLICFQQWSKMILGVTYMDVTKTENNIKTRQLLTERFTGTWAISYRLNKILDIDYTGNLYGPMRLPLLGALDPRSEYSPTWSIQNIHSLLISSKLRIVCG
jgi:outer membrane receptor for ferrienterochelin and colicins